MQQEENNQELIILEVPAYGSFVYKSDIRNLLGIHTYDHWAREIELIKAEQEDFSDLYTQGSSHHRISTHLARLIIESIYHRSGQLVKLQFVWGGG